MNYIAGVLYLIGALSCWLDPRAHDAEDPTWMSVVESLLWPFYDLLSVIEFVHRRIRPDPITEAARDIGQMWNDIKPSDAAVVRAQESLTSDADAETIRARYDELYENLPAHYDEPGIWDHGTIGILLVYEARAALQSPPVDTGDRDYKALYFELLYQVEKVTPNETRHESAKRIIHQHETMCGQGGPSQAAREAK